MSVINLAFSSPTKRPVSSITSKSTHTATPSRQSRPTSSSALSRRPVFAVPNLIGHDGEVAVAYPPKLNMSVSAVALQPNPSTTATTTSIGAAAETSPSLGDTYASRGRQKSATVRQLLMHSNSSLPTLPRRIQTATTSSSSRNPPLASRFLQESLTTTSLTPLISKEALRNTTAPRQEPHVTAPSAVLSEKILAVSHHKNSVDDGQDDAFIQNDGDDGEDFEVVIASAIAAASINNAPRDAPQAAHASTQQQRTVRSPGQRVRSATSSRRPMSMVTSKSASLLTNTTAKAPAANDPPQQQADVSSRTVVKVHHHTASGTHLLELAGNPAIAQAAEDIQRPGSAHPTVTLAVGALDAGVETAAVLTSVLRHPSAVSPGLYQNTGVGFSRVLASLGSSQRFTSEVPDDNAIASDSVVAESKHTEQDDTSNARSQRISQSSNVYEAADTHADQNEGELILHTDDTYAALKSATTDIMALLRPSTRIYDVSNHPPPRPVSASRRKKLGKEQAFEHKTMKAILGVHSTQPLLRPTSHNQRASASPPIIHEPEDFSRDAAATSRAILDQMLVKRAPEFMPMFDLHGNRPASASARLESPLKSRPRSATSRPDSALSNANRHRATVVGELVGQRPAVTSTTAYPEATTTIEPYKGLLLRQESEPTQRLHLSLKSMRPLSASRHRPTDSSSNNERNGFNNERNGFNNNERNGFGLGVSRIELTSPAKENSQGPLQRARASASPKKHRHPAMIPQFMMHAAADDAVVTEYDGVIDSGRVISPPKESITTAATASTARKALLVMTDQEDFQAWNTQEGKIAMDLASPPSKPFEDEDLNPPSPRFSGSLARLMAAVGKPNGKQSASKLNRRAKHAK